MQYLKFVLLAAALLVALVLYELREYLFVISAWVVGFGALCAVIFIGTMMSNWLADSCNRWLVVLDGHRDRQFMRFKADEIVIEHARNGFKVVHMPVPARSITTVEVEQPKALPAPDFKMPTGDDLLAKISQDDILLGYEKDGTERRATWELLRAILILGLSGGGKTSTAIWLIIQMLMQGGRVALIDKHARVDGSMYARLKPFSSRFDCPHSDNPPSALRVIKHVRKELNDRLEGKPCAYPFLLVVDEVTAIMRQRETGEEWSLAAGELTGLIEALNTEGRKFRMFALCVGQASNASRSGGTETRDTYPTYAIHRMKKKQAAMVGMSAHKEMIANLKTGYAVFDTEDSDEPFTVRVPYASDEIVQAVVHRLEQVQEQYSEGTERVQQHCSVTTEDLSKSALQANVQDLEKVQRVLKLRETGLGKIAIIEEVWEARKGGSKEYRLASEEYDEIMKSLKVE